MARIVSTDVTAIIDTTLSGTQIDPFITAANVLVNKALSSKGLGEDQLTEIERWLAAHFLSQHDRREEEIWLGDWRAKFEGNTHMYLENSRYGQQAMVLDTSGTLAKLGKSAALFTVISEDDIAS